MKIDMTGKRIAHLLVLEEVGRRQRAVVWRCRCDCGVEKTIAGTDLRRGAYISCGCATRFKSGRGRTHGASGEPTYSIWSGMLSRCSEASKGKSRRLYFDKGIRVCDEWHSYEGFVADMGVRPDGMSIDRIDGNKGYNKENCRWATQKEQANNTSRNQIIEANGKSQTVAAWAEETGLIANTIIYRLRRGWPAHKAVQCDAVGIPTERKMNREKPCLICGKLFIPRKTQLKAGHGKFCSQACNGQSRIAQV